ncbi:MAG TPA: right-handed parallel beta-helix repeat-containing protein [Rudaea sp.]|jgi:hypothetical protein|nr:right-handed parallel beta-helix repeat-containing protein [Rudaea sp.]
MMKLVAAAVLVAVCGGASAATIEIGPAADFRTAMQTLQAGDTLILDAGTYTLTSYFNLSLNGTSALPITIMAKPGTRPLVQFSGTSQNIVNFTDTTFLIVDGIDFSGGSRGLRFMGGSDDIVRNCIIHDTAANAISANDDGEDYARFQFLHNEIYNTGDTGEGFYLGCNGDACRIHDSIVANNYIHDLDNSNISQGDGIEIKKGSYANIVRDNVIRDVNYPGITMYDVNGHGAPNLIERNIIWNSHDSGIQITADAIVRNNIVLGAANNAFFSNNIDSGSANNLTIVNNTFLMPQGDGIRLNGVTGSVLIANNAIYAPNGDALHASGTTTGITLIANAGQGTLNGISGPFASTGNIANDFVSANFSGVPPQNLIPKGALLVGTGNAADESADDFDGHSRSGHVDIGAYRAGGAPGWTIASAFKTLDEIYFGTFDP